MKYWKAGQGFQSANKYLSECLRNMFGNIDLHVNTYLLEVATEKSHPDHKEKAIFSKRA